MTQLSSLMRGRWLKSSRESIKSRSAREYAPVGASRPEGRLVVGQSRVMANPLFAGRYTTPLSIGLNGELMQRAGSSTGASGGKPVGDSLEASLNSPWRR